MTGLLYLLFFCSGVQRTDLPGRLGPRVRQCVRQHDLLGLAGHRRVHARPRRRQLHRRRLGRSPVCRPTGVAAPRIRLLRVASSAAWDLASQAFCRIWGRSRRSSPPTRATRTAGTCSRRPPTWPAQPSPSLLLTPITLLMGGTLTLLIRHLVRKDLDVGGWRIAALYGVNTAGAALGCFLTDFALVPASGLGPRRWSRWSSTSLRRRARSGWQDRRTGTDVLRSRFGDKICACLSQHRTKTPVRLVRSTSPRARPFRLCGDGHGDPVVPPFQHPARRIPRRVLAAADRHPARHRRGLARRGIPASPHRSTGAMVDRRAGTVRRLDASRIGQLPMRDAIRNAVLAHALRLKQRSAVRGVRFGRDRSRSCGSTRDRCCWKSVSRRC